MGRGDSPWAQVAAAAVEAAEGVGLGAGPPMAAAVVAMTAGGVAAGAVRVAGLAAAGVGGTDKRDKRPLRLCSYHLNRPQAGS